MIFLVQSVKTNRQTARPNNSHVYYNGFLDKFSLVAALVLCIGIKLPSTQGASEGVVEGLYGEGEGWSEAVQ